MPTAVSKLTHAFAAPACAVLLTIVFASAAVADDVVLRLPETLPTHDVDSYEAELLCRAARVVGDRALVTEQITELAADHGDQDWALAQIGQHLRCVHGYAEARRLLSDRDVLSGPLAGLSDPALDLVEAVVAYNGSRYATADRLFERAVAARPEWTRCHAYLFLVDGDLLRPVEVKQRRVDACAGDVRSLEVILYRLLFRMDDQPDHPTRVGALALIEAGPRSPGLDLYLDLYALCESLRTVEAGAEEMAEAWRALAAEHGDLAWLYAGDAAYEMTRYLPTADALELLTSLGEHPLGEDFRVRADENLVLLDRPLEALRRLDGEIWTSSMIWDLRIRALGRVAHVDTLREAVLAARSEVITPYRSALMKRQLLDLGEKETWSELWAELEVESPRKAMLHRLSEMTYERNEEYAALLDSLGGLRLLPDDFLSRRRSEEVVASGEPTLEEIVEEPDPVKRRDLIASATTRADLAGDDDERRRVLAAAIDAGEGWVFPLKQALARAMSASDRELAERALNAMERALPGDPLVVVETIRTKAIFEGRNAARPVAEDVDVADWREPGPVLEYGFLANALDLSEAADAACRRALELSPHGIDALLFQVELHRRDQDHAAADVLLAGLAAGRPGSSYIDQKRLEGGTSVTSLADVPEPDWDPETVFAPFAYDLDDVDALRAMAATGAALDSLQGDAYVLRERNSVVLVGADTEHRRSRSIVQILSEAGAQMNRTRTITFSPDDGVPLLRVARVITPDGRVVEAPRDEIVIRAPEGGAQDVSDVREMVIPLAGVEEGAIVDVVHDRVSSSYLSGGWSTLIYLAGGGPSRELLYEIIAPEDTDLRFAVGEGVESVVDVPDPRIRAWRVVDAEGFAEEEWSAPVDEVLPWIAMTSYRDWDDLARTFAVPYWEQARGDEAVKEKAEELCRDLDSKDEKAAALYRYVAEDVSGLAVELGLGRIIPTPPGETLARGWGDCKDSSALLIAMLDAVGVKARPVLVSVWGGVSPRDDLPLLSAFDHMIVQITDLDGDPYCDPLNGTGCIAPPPAASIGRLGLHLDRDGGAELKLVAETTPEDHGYEMTADLTPTGETEMRYDIVCTYRGEAAGYMRTALAFGDTNITRGMLDMATGYGVAGGVPIRSWDVQELDCGRVEVHMTYVDTAWAPEGATSAELQFLNELAIYWELPDSEDRSSDVVFRSPYASRVELRLHASDVWEPSQRLAEFSFDGDHHDAALEVRVEQEDDHEVVVVDHEYRLRERRIPAEDYEAFQREALGYFMHSARVYRYHRAIDEGTLERMMAYADEFPDDHAFRINAAAELLGASLGGYDEHGRRRRDLARTLLWPVLESGEGVSYVAMLAAAMESMDGRYVAADSLLDAALAGNANDMQLLFVSANVKNELDDFDGEVDRYATLANVTGNAEVIKNLYRCLLVGDRGDEADRQLLRLEMMGASPDSLELALLRFAAHERAGNPEAMQEVFGELEHMLEDEYLLIMRTSLDMASDRYADAAVKIEKQLGDRPTDPMLCNNLAWSYALTGVELDRAEMLAEAASLMSSDPTASRNTLGAVYARQGRWKEARDLFRLLFAGDDRPGHRLANGYFLGLSEAVLGDAEAAERVWAQVDEIPGDPEISGWLEESRRLLGEDRDPAAAVFHDDEPTQEGNGS